MLIMLLTNKRLRITILQLIVWNFSVGDCFENESKPSSRSFTVEVAFIANLIIFQLGTCDKGTQV